MRFHTRDGLGNLSSRASIPPSRYLGVDSFQHVGNFAHFGRRNMAEDVAVEMDDAALPAGLGVDLRYTLYQTQTGVRDIHKARIKSGTAQSNSYNLAACRPGVWFPCHFTSQKSIMFEAKPPPQFLRVWSPEAFGNLIQVPSHGIRTWRRLRQRSATALRAATSRL